MRQETDEELRAEADWLLDSGLRKILSEYGEVHIIGSYALQLMVGGIWTFIWFTSKEGRRRSTA